MLNTPSEFPNPGSTAYLRPSGEAVRIIQHNADGTRLIAVRGKAGAGANLTAAASDLTATLDEAIARPLRTRRARAGR